MGNTNTKRDETVTNFSPQQQQQEQLTLTHLPLEIVAWVASFLSAKVMRVGMCECVCARMQ